MLASPKIRVALNLYTDELGGGAGGNRLGVRRPLELEPEPASPFCVDSPNRRLFPFVLLDLNDSEEGPFAAASNADLQSSAEAVAALGLLSVNVAQLENVISIDCFSENGSRFPLVVIVGRRRLDCRTLKGRGMCPLTDGFAAKMHSRFNFNVTQHGVKQRAIPRNKLRVKQRAIPRRRIRYSAKAVNLVKNIYLGNICSKAVQNSFHITTDLLRHPSKFLFWVSRSPCHCFLTQKAS
ncbi:hypothetical protein M5K25_027737 [Dendrobium thyrsiflorum]|uniref:Uncharacterized protein n=1 Tax=Dendrobium thyrsiflorum TaxID=117978 RepID=A0ABD0TUQ8_DENTH